MNDELELFAQFIEWKERRGVFSEHPREESVMTRLTATIPEGLHAEIKMEAALNRTTVSELIETLIINYLKAVKNG